MEKSDTQYSIANMNMFSANATLSNITKKKVLEIMCISFVVIFCMVFNVILAILKKIHILLYSIDQDNFSHDENDQITRKIDTFINV